MQPRRGLRPDDAALRVRLRELAGERRRFGYRRLGYLLEREGITPNHKKLLRMYREEGLKVRRRGGRKRALGTRAPMALPQGPNQRWSLDFVSDAMACGRRFRLLCVVDDFTRECLALVPDTSLSGGTITITSGHTQNWAGRPPPRSPECGNCTRFPLMAAMSDSPERQLLGSGWRIPAALCPRLRWPLQALDTVVR